MIIKILLEVSQIVVNVAIIIFIMKALNKRGPFECIHDDKKFQKR